MRTIRAQYIYLYESIEAARGLFKNNTNGGLCIVGIDEVSNRVRERKSLILCARLSCGSAVIYFRLHDTHEMHFDDGTRINGFSIHIICKGEI